GILAGLQCDLRAAQRPWPEHQGRRAWRRRLALLGRYDRHRAIRVQQGPDLGEGEEDLREPSLAGLQAARLGLRRDDLHGTRRDDEPPLAKDIGMRGIGGLGPAVEGMLVALGTLQANAQERSRRPLANLFERRRPAKAPEQVEAGAVGINGGNTLLRR